MTYLCRKDLAAVSDDLFRDILLSQCLTTLALPTSSMRQKHVLGLLLLAYVATVIAVPVPEGQEEKQKSVGEHLQEVGMWLIGGATALTLAMGGATYATSWWHRMQSAIAKDKDRQKAWNATQFREDERRNKDLEALDIVLGMSKDYADALMEVKKPQTDFDPSSIADELQAEIEKLQVKGGSETPDSESTV